MPAMKPAALTTLGPDDMDNQILVNRSAVRDHADLLDSHTAALTDHAARLTALEAGGAPITGTASATIVITAAQEAQLNGLQTGAFALLQGPTADFLFKREGR